MPYEITKTYMPDLVHVHAWHTYILPRELLSILCQVPPKQARICWEGPCAGLDMHTLRMPVTEGPYAIPSASHRSAVMISRAYLGLIVAQWRAVEAKEVSHARTATRCHSDHHATS